MSTFVRSAKYDSSRGPSRWLNRYSETIPTFFRPCVERFGSIFSGDIRSNIGGDITGNDAGINRSEEAARGGQSGEGLAYADVVRSGIVRRGDEIVGPDCPGDRKRSAS